MDKRSMVLLGLAALSVVVAYYFYFYEADSIFFTGPAGTLMLMASVFLTGSLLAGGRARRQHGSEHGHAHGHAHGGHAHQGRHAEGMRHEDRMYENRETSDVPPSSTPPAGPGRQG